MPEKRLRRSRQREKIVELLRGTDQHPTAGRIYDHLKEDFPSLSLGTVYRNLAILVEQGTVRKLESGSTFDRYEINRGDHVHFVCERCGRITDLDIPELGRIEDAVRRHTGYAVTGQKVEVFGICAACSGSAFGELDHGPEKTAGRSEADPFCGMS